MILHNLELLARGTLVTIEVTLAASLLAALVALVAGTARSSRHRILRATAGAFIEVFRGTSALVQLYVAFFVLPFAGITLTPFVAGVIVVGLNVGSYGAEIVRAGLSSVPQGQREAAIVLDMPPWPRFRHVILPSAMLIILRPAGNQFIEVLKVSSLVSLVTLRDLTFEGQVIRSEAGETAQVFFVLLVIYFALSSIIAWLVNVAERRVRRGIDAVAPASRGGSPKRAIGSAEKAEVSA